MIATKEELKEFEGIEINTQIILSITCIVSEKDKPKITEFLERGIKSPHIQYVFIESYLSDREELVISHVQNNLRVGKYYHKENEFSFCNAKNFAKRLATGKWILNLDVDEYVDVEQFEYLWYTCLGNSESVDGYSMLIKSKERNNFTNEVEEKRFKAVRLFRNLPEIWYIGHKHAFVEFNIDEEKIFGTSIEIINEGLMNITYEEQISKLKYNLKQIARTIWDTDREDVVEKYLEFFDRTLSGIKELQNKGKKC